jgi:hypothetical protein
MFLQQKPAGLDDVFSLGIEQTNCPDIAFQARNAQIQNGLWSVGNRIQFLGALLTPTSVACADNMTEISNSNGLPQTSSVVGCGSLSLRRE